MTADGVVEHQDKIEVHVRIMNGPRLGEVGRLDPGLAVGKRCNTEWFSTV